MHPAITPGSVIGNVTRKNTDDRARAEIGARLAQRRAQALDRRVERQDHQRQVRVEQAHHDRELVVQERERLLDHPEPRGARG